MGEPRPSLGTAGRFLAGLAIALLVVLGLSFLLSSAALDDEEAAAAERAERLTSSVVAPGLTPDLVAAEIEGTAYRDLLIRVQDGALSQGGAVAVRIWSLEGEPIFSSTGDVDRVLARNLPWLEAAAEGETVWVIAEASAGSAPGLQQGEELFETFVPLRLDDQRDPSAVVQVDRRYEVIEEEATRVWRPVQVGLIIGLGVVVVLLGIALPGSAAPATTTLPEEADAASSRADRTLRDADERAAAAERATREAEQRLADAERRLEEASRAEVPPEIMARVDELQRKLRAAERERERSADQVRKLRSELAAKEAAGASPAATPATTEPAQPETDGEQLAALREALAAAERRLEEAASSSDRAGVDLAGSAKDLTTTKAALEAKTGELRAATSELERAKSDLELARTELERTRTGLQGANADLEATKTRLERRLKEIDANRQAEVGELQRAREALATTQVELLEAKSARREAEARVQELEGRVAELGARAEAEEPAAPVGSFSGRLAELRQEFADSSRAAEASAPDGEEVGDVLSLRERLTRAAAARHRPPGGEQG